MRESYTFNDFCPKFPTTLNSYRLKATIGGETEVDYFNWSHSSVFCSRIRRMDHVIDPVDTVNYDGEEL